MRLQTSGRPSPNFKNVSALDGYPHKPGEGGGAALWEEFNVMQFKYLIYVTTTRKASYLQKMPRIGFLNKNEPRNPVPFLWLLYKAGATVQLEFGHRASTPTLNDSETRV